MSIGKQIKELRDLRFRMGVSNKPTSTDWKIVDSVIDTIEALSAKLSDKRGNCDRSRSWKNILVIRR